ncbi:hypothetical protein B0A49_12327, partial [Cryomyces minteri]
ERKTIELGEDYAKHLMEAARQVLQPDLPQLYARFAACPDVVKRYQHEHHPTWLWDWSLINEPGTQYSDNRDEYFRKKREFRTNVKRIAQTCPSIIDDEEVGRDGTGLNPSVAGDGTEAKLMESYENCCREAAANAATYPGLARSFAADPEAVEKYISQFDKDGRTGDSAQRMEDAPPRSSPFQKREKKSVGVADSSTSDLRPRKPA